MKEEAWSNEMRRIDALMQYASEDRRYMRYHTPIRKSIEDFEAESEESADEDVIPALPDKI